MLKRILNIGVDHPLNDWEGDDHLPGYWLPAPIALKDKPGEAGQKVRVKYIAENMKKLVALQPSREAAKKLLRLRGGLFNEDGNAGYKNNADPTQSFIPLDGPWPEEPIAQPIASILATVNVLETRGAWSRIETLDPSKPINVTPSSHPHLFFVFKSLQSGTDRVGNAIDDAGVIIPLFATGEAWIPNEILEDVPQGVKMIDFIDAYYGDGVIDWPLLKQNTRGAIVKAGDGYYMPVDKGSTGLWNFYTHDPAKRWHYDPYFPQNWQGASDLQLRGAYWFVRFNYEKRPWDTDAGMERQAELFCKRVMGYGLFPGDVLVADVEQVTSQISYLTRVQKTDRLRQFLAKVEDIAGVRPMIYTGWGWWDEHIGVTTWAKDYLLWAADYTPPLKLPIGWSTYWGHQFSDKVIVPGIPTAADANSFGPAYAPQTPTPQPPMSIEAILADHETRIAALEAK